MRQRALSRADNGRCLALRKCSISGALQSRRRAETRSVVPVYARPPFLSAIGESARPGEALTRRSPRLGLLLVGDTPRADRGHTGAQHRSRGRCAWPLNARARRSTLDFVACPASLYSRPRATAPLRADHADRAIERFTSPTASRPHQCSVSAPALDVCARPRPSRPRSRIGASESALSSTGLSRARPALLTQWSLSSTCPSARCMSRWAPSSSTRCVGGIARAV